jgi:hypothetical protein
MVFEKAIENHCTGHAGLNALIAGRIYPDAIPQSATLPAIAYSIISSIDDHSFGIDSDLTEARVQFAIATENPGSRALVDAQLKAAFKDFSGVMGGAGGVQVHSALQENRTSSHSPETGIYLRTVDFMFIYDAGA